MQQQLSGKKVKKVVKKKVVVNHSMIDPNVMATITSGGESTNIGYVSYIRDQNVNIVVDNSRRTNSNSVEPHLWRRPLNNSNLR